MILTVGVMLLDECKEKDVAPKMADTVAGMYTMNYIKVGANEMGLPVGSISGTIELTKVDDGRVKVVAVLRDKSDGSSETILNGDELTLSTNDKRIEFSVSSKQAGHYENNQVELLGTAQGNGDVIIMRGNR